MIWRFVGDICVLCQFNQTNMVLQRCHEYLLLAWLLSPFHLSMIYSSIYSCVVFLCSYVCMSSVSLHRSLPLYHSHVLSSSCFFSCFYLLHVLTLLFMCILVFLSAVPCLSSWFLFTFIFTVLFMLIFVCLAICLFACLSKCLFAFLFLFVFIFLFRFLFIFQNHPTGHCK